MTETRTRICRRCRHYSPCYTKGCISFFREKYGFCTRLQKIMPASRGCSAFCRRQDAPVSVREIDDAIAAVEALQQLLSL